MGGFDFNGVNGTNGTTPVFGTGKKAPAEDVKGFEKTFDFGMDAVGDSFKATTKPAFNSMDLDQMWQMAGIKKPEAIKSLESTMNFAAEGAEYGVEYSEDDMNLARFIFENVK